MYALNCVRTASVRLEEDMPSSPSACFITWPPTTGMWEDSMRCHHLSWLALACFSFHPQHMAQSFRLSIEHCGDGRNSPGVSIFAVTIITLVSNISQSRDVKTSPCQNVGSSGTPSSAIIGKLNKSLCHPPYCLAINQH